MGKKNGHLWADLMDEVVFEKRTTILQQSALEVFLLAPTGDNMGHYRSTAVTNFLIFKHKKQREQHMSHLCNLPSDPSDIPFHALIVMGLDY